MTFGLSNRIAHITFIKTPDQNISDERPPNTTHRPPAMCEATIKIHRGSNGKFVLASLGSFSEYEKSGYPSDFSKLTTCIFVVVLLTMTEQTIRQVLASIQDFHPLLQDEMNRINFAKHFGVNTTALFTCAYLGWQARYILQDMYDTVIRGKNAMPKAYDNRLFKYYPEAARITVIFLGYQIKNAYDSIYWGDDALLIGHHILAFFVALGGVFPGCVHYYVPFYLGMSEISSVALSVLVNFDDEHGVKGLGDEFPIAKAAIGAIFAVLFIVFRVFMWSTVSYFYCRDVWNVLGTNDPRLEGRKTYLRFTAVALGLLSLLQVIWLAEIFRTGKEILLKADLL
eukprot:scaffold4809_cov116-Cylindrotheca_fusiformis.AAC.5